MQKLKSMMMSGTALTVVLVLAAVLGAGHKWY